MDKRLQASFQELKAYLDNSPHLVSLLIGNMLYLYLAVTNHAMFW